MEFIEKKVKIRKGYIHYLDNEYPADELILVLPPGIDDARFIKKLNLTNLKKRVISVTYPSRYKSDLIEDNNLENIADRISLLIKKCLTENNIHKMKLIGFSFGTAIATIILQNHNSFSCEVEALLINPGEFFNETTKFLLKTMFLPAKYFQSYRIALKFLLCNFLKLFNSKYFPDKRLKELNDQWISILNYKIKNIPINEKVTLVTGNSDRITTAKSLKQIKKLIQNPLTISYDGSHAFYYENSKDYLKFKTKLLFFINS